MRLYKGFNKDMTCRGFQYEEGKEYKTDKAKLFFEGFHACEYPLDCFKYYPPNKSIYHEVQLDEMTKEISGDSKRCAKKIRIGAKLTIEEMIKASLEYIKARGTNLKGGDFSVLGGWMKSALQGGDCSILQSGNYSALQGGDCSALQGADDSALKGGCRSVLQGGDYSICYGDLNSLVKGGVGSVLAVQYFDNNGKLKVAHGVVGQDLKEYTWYVERDGKLVEFNEVK